VKSVLGELSIGGGGTEKNAPCWWPNPPDSSKKSGGILLDPNWRENAALSPGGGGGGHSPSPMSGPSTAMTELANLVNAHPRSALGPLRMHSAQVTPDVLDMRPVLGRLAAAHQREQMNHALDEAEASAGDNESLSSRLSDKNLADFEDENSVDEEMLQLSENHEELGAILQQQQQQGRNETHLNTDNAEVQTL
jgi:hypothetical protein